MESGEYSVGTSGILPLASPGCVTKDWLKLLLSQYYKMSVDIDSFDVRTSEEKLGFLSELAFMKVCSTACNDSKKSDHLVVKCLPSSDELKAFILEGRLPLRESEFYSMFFSPTYADTLEKLLLKTEPVIPEVLYSGCSEDKFTLVLRDLGKEGYKTIVTRDGCTLLQAKVAFRSIAAIHAFGIANFEKTGKYGARGCADLNFVGSLLVSNFTTLQKIYEDTAGHNNLVKKFKELQCYSKSLLNSYLEGSSFLKTMVHGDFWMGQCMFSADETRAVVIDWQFCSMGDLIKDIVAFFCMSADPYILRHNLEEILMVYWESLCGYLTKVDIKLEKTYQEFCESVDRQWIFGFIHLVCSLHDFQGADNISDYRLKGLISFLDDKSIFEPYLKNKKLS